MVMKFGSLAGVMIASLSLIAGGANAASFSFKLVNSSKYYISSFEVNEGKGWGKSPLDESLKPGESTTIRFLHDGPCKIRMRVWWELDDGEHEEVSEPWNIDICDAHHVYFDGKEVTYD